MQYSLSVTRNTLSIHQVADEPWIDPGSQKDQNWAKLVEMEQSHSWESLKKQYTELLL